MSRLPVVNSLDQGVVNSLDPQETTSTTDKEQETESPLQFFSESELQNGDPVEVFLHDTWRRIRGIRLKLNRKADASLLEECRRVEQSVGREEFRLAALHYLYQDSDFLKRENWPLPTLLKQIRNGDLQESSPPPTAPPCAPTPAGEAADTEAIPADPPIASSAPESVNGLPPLAEQWNREVPHGPPVDRWTRWDKTLEARMNDPEFVANASAIFIRCERACKNRPEDCPWLSFRWLFGTNKDYGCVNWYRVLTGSMDWAAQRKRPKTKQEEINDIFAELDAEDANHRTEHQASA